MGLLRTGKRHNKVTSRVDHLALPLMNPDRAEERSCDQRQGKADGTLEEMNAPVRRVQLGSCSERLSHPRGRSVALLLTLVPFAWWGSLRSPMMSSRAAF